MSDDLRQQLKDSLAATGALRLCKDCKWFSPAEDEFASPKCQHPSAFVEDRVFGQHTHYICSTHRNYDKAPNSCGRAAKFFEPRANVVPFAAKHIEGDLT